MYEDESNSKTVNRGTGSMRSKNPEIKQRLFDVAITLIGEKGYNEVTVADICKKAEVAKGTFYIYYKSKDEIIRESYRSSFKDFMEKKFQQYLESNPDASALNQIKKFLTTELEFAVYTGSEVTNRAYAANFIACANGEWKWKRSSEISDRFKELFEETDLDASTKDHLIMELKVVVSGLMVMWGLNDGDFDIVSAGQRFFDSLLDPYF